MIRGPCMLVIWRGDGIREALWKIGSVSYIYIYTYYAYACVCIYIYTHELFFQTAVASTPWIWWRVMTPAKTCAAKSNLGKKWIHKNGSTIGFFPEDVLNCWMVGVVHNGFAPAQEIAARSSEGAPGGTHHLGLFLFGKPHDFMVTLW